MIRGVHLGDLHLWPGPRNADRRAAVAHVLEAERRRRVDIWLWPGDLNHAAMSIDDRNWLAAQLADMADRAPVVLCYGNHDRPGDLEVFGRLKTKWPVLVVHGPCCVDVALPREESMRVFVLPYPSKSGLVGAGVPHDELGQAAARALDIIFMDAAGSLDEARARRMPVCMIGHVNVAGAVASTGQPQIGQELEISDAHLARLGDCYKGLNHIHLAQHLPNSPGASYAGSLCRLDWGETEPKGYAVIEWRRAAAGVWEHTMSWETVPVAPMYHVEAQVQRDDWAWACTNGPDGKQQQAAPESWVGCDVRVRARFAQAERDVLGPAFEALRREFDGARRLEFDPIAVPDRALRSAEVARAQTFDEKLAAWAHIMGVSWSATLTACATRLQSPEGADAVVADTEARLKPLASLPDDTEPDEVPAADFMLTSEDAE